MDIDSGWKGSKALNMQWTRTLIPTVSQGWIHWQGAIQLTRSFYYILINKYKVLPLHLSSRASATPLKGGPKMKCKRKGTHSVFPSISLSKQRPVIYYVCQTEPCDVGKGVSSIHHATLSYITRMLKKWGKSMGRIISFLTTECWWRTVRRFRRR